MINKTRPLNESNFPFLREGVESLFRDAAQMILETHITVDDLLEAVRLGKLFLFEAAGEKGVKIVRGLTKLKSMMDGMDDAQLKTFISGQKQAHRNAYSRASRTRDDMGDVVNTIAADVQKNRRSLSAHRGVETRYRERERGTGDDAFYQFAKSKINRHVEAMKGARDPDEISTHKRHIAHLTKTIRQHRPLEGDEKFRAEKRKLAKSKQGELSGVIAQGEKDGAVKAHVFGKITQDRNPVSPQTKRGRALTLLRDYEKKRLGSADDLDTGKDTRTHHILPDTDDKKTSLAVAVASKAKAAKQRLGDMTPGKTKPAQAAKPIGVRMVQQVPSPSSTTKKPTRAQQLLMKTKNTAKKIGKTVLRAASNEIRRTVGIKPKARPRTKPPTQSSLAV